MEIQQKDNDTLAAFIHHFKMAAKQCDFDNDTAAICIFVEGLRHAHTTTAKIYEKDSQTLSEVIRIIEKYNAAQQVTDMLTPSMVSRMSNNDRCFICGQTGHHYHDAQFRAVPPLYHDAQFTKLMTHIARIWRRHFEQDCPQQDSRARLSR